MRQKMKRSVKMFGKFSMLTFIAAVALIVVAVPAPAAAQLEASAVAGYGFRSQNRSLPATRGPLIRGSALLRVIGPVALGSEIGYYWPGEVRSSDFYVERDRILTYGLCVELGKPRPGISPRLTLGVSWNSVSTTTETDTYTDTSSQTVMAPHLGLVMVRKPAAAMLGLRAEVRTALMFYSPERVHLLTSVSVGVTF
jgi:hypothetical protein